MPEDQEQQLLVTKPLCEELPMDSFQANMQAWSADAVPFRSRQEDEVAMAAHAAVLAESREVGRHGLQGRDIFASTTTLLLGVVGRIRSLSSTSKMTARPARWRLIEFRPGPSLQLLLG